TAKPAVRGEVVPVAAMTSTGPTANHELASTASSRTGRSSPRATSRSFATAHAAGTTGSTSAGGSAKSSGTKATCVGTVMPAAVSNSVLAATTSAMKQQTAAVSE